MDMDGKALTVAMAYWAGMLTACAETDRKTQLTVDGYKEVAEVLMQAVEALKIMEKCTCSNANKS